MLEFRYTGSENAILSELIGGEKGNLVGGRTERKANRIIIRGEFTRVDMLQL